jgi:hypothetical protein
LKVDRKVLKHPQEAKVIAGISDMCLEFGFCGVVVVE